MTGRAAGIPGTDIVIVSARQKPEWTAGLIVVMGEQALAFLNGLGFPLARTLEAREGERQELTPTIEAIYTPDIDAALDEQAEKTRFWNAFKPLGAWWESLPPY